MASIADPIPISERPGRHAHWLAPVEGCSFSSRRITPIRHNFDGHPLMQLPALERLAKDLRATGQCRFIKPGSTQVSPFHHSAEDAAGREIEEVFHRIEEPGSWIALYNVETHPDYRRFVDEVADCFRPLVEPEQPGIFNVGGFIFISAPPSVTPFHIDRENNFWLQVRGRKQMFVWDRGDRKAVPAKEVDKFIVWGGGDVAGLGLKEVALDRGNRFDVGPGDGVYFPSTSPHMTTTEPSWARPGDGISVSIGVVFYTEETRRAAYVHAWNLQLRKLGLEPALPGQSPWSDRIKYLAGRGLVGFQSRFRGYKRQVGM